MNLRDTLLLSLLAALFASAFPLMRIAAPASGRALPIGFAFIAVGVAVANGSRERALPAPLDPEPLSGRSPS